MSRLYQNMLYSRSMTEQAQRLPALSFGQADASKPVLSFPLGTGLVVVIILVVSALFSFCYHWFRLRKLGSPVLPTHDVTQPASTDDCMKETPPTKLAMLQCPPVVYMAGEDMPRFIAVPCAFEGGYRKATAEDAHDESVPKPLESLKLDIRL